jgi:hypothetical protein
MIVEMSKMNEFKLTIEPLNTLYCDYKQYISNNGLELRLYFGEQVFAPTLSLFDNLSDREKLSKIICLDDKNSIDYSKLKIFGINKFIAGEEHGDQIVVFRSDNFPSIWFVVTSYDHRRDFYKDRYRLVLRFDVVCCKSELIRCIKYDICNTGIIRPDPKDISVESDELDKIFSGGRLV